MSLNANALTDVAQCKLQLDIPSSDTSQNTRLELFINAASQAIESHCNRSFKSASRTEYFHGRKQNMIMPREYPVTGVTTLHIDNERVFGSDTLVDAADYSIADRGNTILLNRVFPQGQSNVKLVYTAGYADIPSDLELACIWLVEWYFKHRERKDMGRKNVSKGDENISIYGEIPPMILQLLQNYIRVEVPDIYSPVENR